MRRMRGTTLIETLVSVGIIAVVMVFMFGMFYVATQQLGQSKMRVLATAVANEQIEIVRNLAYDQVGTQAPTCEVTGTLPRSAAVVRSNATFTVDTCIRWVDDPFDRLVSSSPPDTVPTDYKLVEVTVTWPRATQPVKLTTTVAPKGLEAPSNTGSLLINVRDAAGTVVSEADVYVTDTNLVPNVDIVSKTDVNGNLQLLGLAPDLDHYHVRVTKAGYTTDQTEPVTAELPNPVRADLSISAGGVLGLGFTIDRVSSIALTTQNETCQAIPGVSFTLSGQKLKGNPPPEPVLKYQQNFTTNASGQATASNLEWDQYSLVLAGSSRNIVGFIPPTMLNVQPNTNVSAQVVLSDTFSANSLLATIKDANTNQPVSGANITVTGAGSKVTGLGAWTQTNWSGGAGQDNYTDASRYSSDTAGIDVTSTSGEVALEAATAVTSVSETFNSTAQRDPATTADWNSAAGELRLPQTAGQYDASALAQSTALASPVGLITQATLSANDQLNGQTVRYYLAADGTTYEQVSPGVAHTFVASGNSLRFRVELETTDPAVTPSVQDININATVKTYAAQSSLTSSTFDTGATSNIVALTWNPQSQGASVGADALRFQLAANDDDTTWNFVGPDGTAATYFASSGETIPEALNGKRYLRYKIFLQTADRAFTPGVSDVSLSYTSGCLPPGQAFFGGLASGNYAVAVTKPGYNDLNVDVNIDGNIQNTFNLVPL